MLGFEAAMPQFEALGAQVVGVSTDPAPSLAAWRKENNGRWQADPPVRFSATPDAHGLWSVETNEQSPVYRMPSALLHHRQDGTVKYVKIMDSPLSLLSAG